MKERKHKIIKLGINKIKHKCRKESRNIGGHFAQHCVSNFENMDVMYEFQKKT